MTPTSQQSNKFAAQLKRSRVFKALGPGLITGAADDDPSGIATYSQAGAQFGFSITWTLLFTYPLMAVIQEVSALIGRTTGKGVAPTSLSKLDLTNRRFSGRDCQHHQHW